MASAERDHGCASDSGFGSAVVDIAGEKTLPSIRRMLFGGDVLTWREVARIRRARAECEDRQFLWSDGNPASGRLLSDSR